jgi:hypothetical protein
VRIHLLARIAGAYACAGAALFGFIWFDELDGGFEAIGAGVPLWVFIPLIGAMAFAAAAIVWVFKPRVAVLLGLLGGAFSWLYYGYLIPHIPWQNLQSVWGYPQWRKELLAIATLGIASAYSLLQTRVWREPSRA